MAKDTPCERAAWRLVHADRHRAQLLAEATGDSAQMIRNRAELNIDTHHTRLKDAVLWQKATGDHCILFEMCAELGYARPPRLPEAVQGGDVGEHAMAAMKEFGEFIAACRAAVADGKLTQAERRAIHKEWIELEAEVSALLSSAERTAPARKR